MPIQPDHGERQSARRTGPPPRVKRPWLRSWFLALELLFVGFGVLYVYFGEARLEETCGAWFRHLQAGVGGALVISIYACWHTARRLAVVGLVGLVLGGILATTQFPPFYTKPEPPHRRVVDSFQPEFRK